MIYDLESESKFDMLVFHLIFFRDEQTIQTLHFKRNILHRAADTMENDRPTATALTKEYFASTQLSIY